MELKVQKLFQKKEKRKKNFPVSPSLKATWLYQVYQAWW